MYDVIALTALVFLMVHWSSCDVSVSVIIFYATKNVSLAQEKACKKTQMYVLHVGKRGFHTGCIQLIDMRILSNALTRSVTLFFISFIRQLEKFLL